MSTASQEILDLLARADHLKQQLDREVENSATVASIATRATFAATRAPLPAAVPATFKLPDPIGPDVVLTTQDKNTQPVSGLAIPDREFFTQDKTTVPPGQVGPAGPAGPSVGAVGGVKFPPAPLFAPTGDADVSLAVIDVLRRHRTSTHAMVH